MTSSVDISVVFSEWLATCRNDQLVSRSPLPTERSDLPAAFVAFVESEKDDGMEVAKAAQDLGGEVAVDVALRQVFLLGQVLVQEMPNQQASRLVRGLWEAAEAISLQHLDTVQNRALTDELTGIGNRRGLKQDLSGALHRVRGGRGSFALAMLDMDGLKVVNDETKSHAAGDHYIRIFSRKVQDFVRENRGKVFRLGGDEFCIVFRDVGRYKAEKVLASLQNEDGVPPFCYGVSACPEDAIDEERLLAIADEERLYEMKAEIGKEARAARARVWLKSPHWD